MAVGAEHWRPEQVLPTKGRAMSSPLTIVIVGASLAGAKTAEALREQGFDGRVVLVGQEQHLPYERPPLSKGYLQGSSPRDEVFVHPQSWYDDHDVDLRLGTVVTALDRAAHRVTTGAGEELAYDKLVLATGSSPRLLTVPGAELPGVHYLRTLDDSDALKEALKPGTRVVVIGGGWIGLETAAAARTAGAEVVVLEYAQQPLLRVLGPQIAPVFAGLHRDHGVDLRVGVEVAGLGARDDGSVGEVVLADGTSVPADVVIAGVGITPNTGLAEQSGVTTDDGILVDAQLRSSDPDVHAVGDVANAFHPHYGRHLRVEHWANALNQPSVVAAALLGGDRTYDRLPYFFTDQYDLGMEYTGLAQPDDSVVVRGDLATRTFIAFWLREGRVTAGMNVNVWDVTTPIKALILRGQPVDAGRLSDDDIPLDQV